ncbi:MAG: hypothetical protein WBX01_02070 [Nitrososphaeraceae archaeon]
MYYSEAEDEDGGTAIGNGLYRNELEDGASWTASDGSSLGNVSAELTNVSAGKLVNLKLLLDLPAVPGPTQ